MLMLQLNAMFEYYRKTECEVKLLIEAFWECCACSLAGGAVGCGAVMDVAALGGDRDEDKSNRYGG